MKRVLLCCLLPVCFTAAAQQPVSAQDAAPYSLRVSVNEVRITFHASDAHDRPVLDLKPEEVDVFENEKGPGQIVSMTLLQQRPVHAAFLIDTSGSVASQVSRSQSEALESVQKVLTQPSDEGSAVMFGRSGRLVQSWTRTKTELLSSIGQVVGSHGPIDGTAVYDTLFSTCHYQFKESDSPTIANVIFLFSDGNDNASYMTLQTAADACRHSHTAVYAFSPKPEPQTASLGASNLRNLTAQTGGHLFYVDDPEGNVHADIETVASDVRSEYLLIYRPKQMIRDGSFHKIVLIGPERTSKLIGTFGFYAPAR